MSKESEPKIERVYCNKCQGKTDHRLIATADGNDSEPEDEFSWSTTFDMLQCCGCQEVVLRRTFYFSEEPDPDVRYFPPVMSRYSPKWRHELPYEMKALLQEIYKSLDSESLRLPMMGARTLVDMLILEKVGDVGSFLKKLEALEKAGLVSSQNRETLYVALDVGSAAAHRGHAPTEPEVQAVMDIVENMLQAVYVFPDVAKKLKKSTPSRPPRKT